MLKPASSSTPLRIVFNSSAKYMNVSLNEMWAKGPDILNSLLGVLLRFREDVVAFTCDLAKMYNTIAMSPFDQHCHRFLWRDLNIIHNAPDHYVLTCVPFGDKPSGTIAMLALKFTAEMSRDKYPDATKIIVDNSYVDDILGNCHDYETASDLMKEIESVVARGGFKIKQWTLSGDQSHASDKVINLAEVDQEKVLGVVWEPKRDVFVYDVKINFSSKRRKVRAEPNLKLGDLADEFPHNLTKRMLLSQVASQYDPLGLVCPVTLTAKLMMRRLISDQDDIDGKSKRYDWDDVLAPQMRSEWLDYFKMLFELQYLYFPRCMRNADVVGKPILY